MHAKYAVVNCVNETLVFYRDICTCYQPKKKSYMFKKFLSQGMSYVIQLHY